MAEPTRPADKAALLAMIQTGYEQFEALLATLRVEQMTLPGVNGSWSVKDNLAHLAAWQNYQAARMEGVLVGTEPSSLASGLEDEDAINEYLYQQHKDHLLPDVLAAFRASYQRVLAATEALSWEALNAPFPWDVDGAPVGAYTLGNTSGHYALHQDLIQHWLEEHSSTGAASLPSGSWWRKHPRHLVPEDASSGTGRMFTQRPFCRLGLLSAIRKWWNLFRHMLNVEWEPYCPGKI